MLVGARESRGGGGGGDTWRYVVRRAIHVAGAQKRSDELSRRLSATVFQTRENPMPGCLPSRCRDRWERPRRESQLDGCDDGGKRSGFGFQAGRTGAIGDGRKREEGDVHVASFVENDDDGCERWWLLRRACHHHGPRCLSGELV